MLALVEQIESFIYSNVLPSSMTEIKYLGKQMQVINEQIEYNELPNWFTKFCESININVRKTKALYLSNPNDLKKKSYWNARTDKTIIPIVQIIAIGNAMIKKQIPSFEVAKELIKRKIIQCHHIDFNQNNDLPNNVVILLTHLHKQLHSNEITLKDAINQTNEYLRSL